MELSRTHKAVLKAIEIGAKLLIYFAGAALALLAAAALLSTFIEGDWFGLVGTAAASFLSYLMFYAAKELF
jgi:hypothetical protein